MENQMRFFQKFKNALYNAEAYAVFLKQGLGKGILYIFILSLILGGIISLKTAYGFNKGINEFINQSEGELPSFRIQDGRLSVDATMPITYKAEDMLFIIDTEQDIDDAALEGYKQGIVISATKMYSKKSTGQVEMLEFANCKDLEVTTTDIAEFITRIRGIGVAIIIACGTLFSFIGKLLSIFIVMGIGGIIVGALVHCKTNYEMSCQLGAYALTVPMLLKFILGLIGMTVPYFFVIYYGIALVYVGRALKAIERQTINSENANMNV
nr:DUF1189 domain-containing protein [uncultured Cellulosilyticum sp.]